MLWKPEYCTVSEICSVAWKTIVMHRLWVENSLVCFHFGWGVNFIVSNHLCAHGVESSKQIAQLDATTQQNSLQKGTKWLYDFYRIRFPKGRSRTHTTKMVADLKQGTHDDATVRIYCCLFLLVYNDVICLLLGLFSPCSNSIRSWSKWDESKRSIVYPEKIPNFLAVPFLSVFFFNYTQCHEYFLLGTTNHLVCGTIIAGCCNKNGFYFNVFHLISALLLQFWCNHYHALFILENWISFLKEKIPASFSFVDKMHKCNSASVYYCSLYPNDQSKTQCRLKAKKKINSFGFMPNRAR